jgi:protein gp37
MAKRFVIPVSKRNNLSREERIKLDRFELVWLENNFNINFPVKKPKRIFVNSMSDIAYWEQEWIENVVERIKEYPQHTFIFLTKIPKVYHFYENLVGGFPPNCMIGVTINTQKDIENLNKAANESPYNFISLEPIQEYIDYELFLYPPDWLIIGAETGNRKNKIIPEKSWIEEFRHIDIPVFMKDNLKDIVDGNLRQEFPA